MFLRRTGLMRVISSSGFSNRKCLSSFVDLRKSYPAEPGHVRSSPYEDLVIPNVTIDKYVWRNFGNWQNKVAAVSVNTSLN